MSELRLKEIDDQIAILQAEKEKIEKQSRIPEIQRKIEEYLKSSYSGKDLLKNHTLDEKGLWRINGEDPNCDFGGCHHNPDLGTFEGTLQKALEFAVEHPKFYTWGSGGYISKINVIKL